MNKRKKTPRTVLVVACLVLLVAIPFVLYTLFHASSARAEWFNSAWSYRKSIRFGNTGSAVTDQKVLIAIDTATPIAAGKMQSSCQDVRFTDAGGKLLQYYINVSGGAGIGCNDASSDFYVLMPSIVAGNNLIYIYYGQPSALAGTVSANFGNTTFSPTSGPTLDAEEQSPGPVALWKMDEGQGSTATDATGHGNSLTLTSTAWATSSASLSNRTQYLQFNGATSVASRANDTEFDFGTGSFSISAWIRHSSNITGTDVLITKYNTQGWKVYMNSSGYICFGIDDDNSYGPDDSACTTTSYADSTWHHIEVVKQGTTSITVYVDGIQKAQTTSLTATATLSTTATLYIGADSSGNTNWWDGWVDDVAIYPYARTASQVKLDILGSSEASRSATLIGASASDPLTNGLVGYWKMDESTGTSVSDISGNGNTGTFTNSPTWAAGKFGSGVQYSDGTTDKYINVPASSSLNNLRPVTYATWVRFTTLTDNRTLFGKSGNVQLYINDHGSSQFRPVFYVDHTGSPDLDVSLTSSSNLSTGVWYHIAVTWDGSTSVSGVKIYINGIEQEKSGNSTSATGTKLDDSGNALGIGNRSSGSLQIEGTMDEARIYNRTLSPKEISRLYDWAPGPVGWWKMDENTGTSSTYDSSGNGYSGTVVGNMTNGNWKVGKYGSSLDFDGIDDRIDVSGFSFPTREFTYSFWFRPDTVSTSNVLLSASGASGGYEINIDTDTDGDVDVIVNNAILLNGTNGLISAGRWNHVSLTRSNGGIYSTFVNGVLDKTGVDATDLAFSACALTIAAGLSSSSCGASRSLWFDGSMDDIRVYNYARTPSQIVEDMNGGHPPGGSPLESSIMHWKFDEANGTTANNSGYLGSTGNGTISGATWYTGGRVGSAIATTTSTNFVSAGDQAFVDNLTGMSIGMWVKPITLATNKALVSKSNFSTQNSFAVVTDNSASDEVRVHIPSSVSDTTTYFLTSNLDLAADTWSYLSFTYNASESASTRVRVYKDGKEVSGSVTGTLPDKMTTGTTSLLKVGASDSGSYTALNAVFDDMKIYPYALTYDQMLIDYNGKAGLQLGSLSTHSDVVTASSSAARQYCPPGNIDSNCASGLNPAPMAEWHLNEPSWTVDCSTATAMDTSGNNYNLRSCPSSTGPRGGVTGIFDKGGYFDGSDDYLESTSTDFNLTGGISLSAWVRPLAIPSGDTYAINRTNNNAGYSLGWSGGMAVRIQIGNGTTYSTLTGSTAMTLGQWYHIAGTVDASGNAVVYLNGKIENSGAINILAGSVGQNLRVGSRAAANTVTGYLDALRIYRYVRSPAQVAWEYNRGKPVGWWKFDENNGSPTTLNDSAGNGLDGTATSGSMDSEDWIAGKLNTSLDFDGSNDVVVVTNSRPVDLNTGLSTGFTFSTWIYPNTVGETAGTIFQKGTNGSVTDASTTFCRVTGSTPFGIECNLDLATSDAVFSVASAAPANQWTHVAFSWTNDSDDEVTIWINGVPSTSSASYAGDPTAEAFNFYIGGNGTTTNNTRAFDGQIDDFRLFNYELTAQQMKMVMNDGAVKFGP